MPKLYRGIAVPWEQKESVIQEIEAKGLAYTEASNCKFLLEPPFSDSYREKMFRKADLSTSDTRPEGDEELYICACGEKQGARYYAYSHNRTKEHDCSLVIELEVNFLSLRIDARDFLCTLFQIGKPAKAREAVIDCFGEEIGRYVEAAWMSDRSQQDYRIALCDLASDDPAVIKGHLRNRAVINGRYRTKFCSAFFVKTPIAPTQIHSIEVIDSFVPTEARWTLPDLVARRE